MAAGAGHSSVPLQRFSLNLISEVQCSVTELYSNRRNEVLPFVFPQVYWMDRHLM